MSRGRSFGRSIARATIGAIFCLLLSTSAGAVEVEAEDVPRPLEPPVSTVAPRRSASGIFALATYSPIDPLITGKVGATLGISTSESRSWELEYLRGSWSVPYIIQDLGSMTDERISLIGRSFHKGGSFQFSYGLSYFHFNAHIGDQMLNRATAGSYPSADLLEFRALGFNLGLGHRWLVARNLLIGVDWVSWAQPVISIERKAAFLDVAGNSSDREAVDTAMRVIGYFPRLVFLKLQIGIQF